MKPVEEPLLESAPLAWQLAPQLCRKDPATGEDCSWYHGLWQILRLMGLASSAAQRAAFYHREIAAAVAGRDAPRVLVCGTADYAMPALVMASLRGHGGRCAITVTDICETPLHLTRWYAERNGSQVETACVDALDYRAPQAFDVICTDGFFSRVPAVRRPALAARWRELLRPGGRIITTNRLHPGSTAGRVYFSAERAQAFLKTVRQAVAEKGKALPIDPEALLGVAEVYARRHDTYTLASLDEMRAMFEQAGFGIETLSAEARAGKPREGGDAKKGKAVLQMHLVAARR